MNTKAELAPKSPGNGLGDGFVAARLKKLRREHRLVERAIMALTEIARTRELRARRASRVERTASRLGGNRK